MPTSFHGQISRIFDFILDENPKSVLDIGVGFGKYGVLCRDQLDIPFERYKKNDWKITIDGIEGYQNYNNPIHNYVYDHIYYGLIQDVAGQLNQIYDMGLMIDVLEHFEKAEGVNVISTLLHKCRCLLISVPAVPGQQTYLDNNLESHKSAWEESDFNGFNVKKTDRIPLGTSNASIIILLEGNRQ
ncbi:MAG: hypothetical protein N2645_03545 [Clostridia bacterium]|nr:hypothetical protein [Clostridia bacterium]